MQCVYFACHQRVCVNNILSINTLQISPIFKVSFFSSPKDKKLTHPTNSKHAKFHFLSFFNPLQALHLQTLKTP